MAQQAPTAPTTPAPATPLQGVPGRAAQSGTSPPARAVGPTALPRNWAKRPAAASRPQTPLHSQQAQRPSCLTDLTRSTVIWDPGPGLPSSPLEKCSRPAPKSRWVHGLKHTAPGSARSAFGLPVGNAPGNPRLPSDALPRGSAPLQSCATSLPHRTAPRLNTATCREHCRRSQTAQWPGAAALASDARPAGAADTPAPAAGSTVGDHIRLQGMARCHS